MNAALRAVLPIAIALGTLSGAPHARAFPPYRSTDAETADPWTLEGRLGPVRYARDEGDNEYTSPLVRVNLGLPQRVELTSELEYLPVEGRVGDAAAGLEWVPYFHALSLGIEVLALLPVAAQADAGVIVKLGSADLSTGAHFGLTKAAPELVVSCWVGGKLPLSEARSDDPDVALVEHNLTQYRATPSWP